MDYPCAVCPRFYEITMAVIEVQHRLGIGQGRRVGERGGDEKVEHVERGL